MVISNNTDIHILVKMQTKHPNSKEKKTKTI